ncbi:hypothetical protein B0H13DRAFT_2683580 [Mycena leptocephala]|nr:hypothetical protein B0H13DRAFT_2683580 [Mycena leptocephala]
MAGYGPPVDGPTRPYPSRHRSAPFSLSPLVLLRFFSLSPSLLLLTRLVEGTVGGRGQGRPMTYVSPSSSPSSPPALGSLPFLPFPSLAIHVLATRSVANNADATRRTSPEAHALPSSALPSPFFAPSPSLAPRSSGLHQIPRTHLLASLMRGTISGLGPRVSSFALCPTPRTPPTSRSASAYTSHIRARASHIAAGAPSRPRGCAARTPLPSSILCVSSLLSPLRVLMLMCSATSGFAFPHLTEAEAEDRMNASVPGCGCARHYDEGALRDQALRKATLRATATGRSTTSPLSSSPTFPGSPTAIPPHYEILYENPVNPRSGNNLCGVDLDRECAELTSIWGNDDDHMDEQFLRPAIGRTFSIELTHPSFNHAIAIANNVDPTLDQTTVELPIVPVGDQYTLQFVNITDINQIFATSGDFSIAAAASPSSTVSTASPSPTSTSIPAAGMSTPAAMSGISSAFTSIGIVPSP